MTFVWLLYNQMQKLLTSYCGKSVQIEGESESSLEVGDMCLVVVPYNLMQKLIILYCEKSLQVEVKLKSPLEFDDMFLVVVRPNAKSGSSFAVGKACK
jgi:hypothetical protein